METQFEYSVTVNLGDGSKTTVSGFVDERHVRNVIFDIEHDECIGPCQCTLEADGTCPNGYPSKLRAAGMI